MRLAEYFMWLMGAGSDATLEKWMGKKKWADLNKKNLTEYADDLNDKIRDAAAERNTEAKMYSPVFECNDTFVELRSGLLENRRGFLTFFSGGFICLIAMFAFLVILIISKTKLSEYDVPLSIALFINIVATLGFGFLYFRFGFKFSRLELFNTRYLLVRFNRVTRQVYLHRSKNCGGVVVMPWEGIIQGYPPSSPLTLIWQRQDGEYGFPMTICGVGKGFPDTDKLRAEWEWLRRYMDEGGLKNLEKPKRMTMLPVPFYVFSTLAEGMQDFFKGAHSVLFWFGMLLASPFIIFIGAMQWISLILCWRPVFPKIIREAGKPGAPVPALTTVDDYPPKIAEQLKKNAHRWLVKPGRKPEKPKGTRKKKEKTGEKEEKAE
jgi:hypothetical protein